MGSRRSYSRPRQRRLISSRLVIAIRLTCRLPFRVDVDHGASLGADAVLSDEALGNDDRRR
jgi:hypothetical protein